MEREQSEREEWVLWERKRRKESDSRIEIERRGKETGRSVRLYGSRELWSSFIDLFILQLEIMIFRNETFHTSITFQTDSIDEESDEKKWENKEWDDIEWMIDKCIQMNTIRDKIIESFEFSYEFSPFYQKIRRRNRTKFNLTTKFLRIFSQTKKESEIEWTGWSLTSYH